MKTKYIFLKKLYFDYVIIFIKNRRYDVLMNDMYVVKYFGNEILINNFKNNHINYILIDGLEINDICSYIDNRYFEFLLKELMIEKIFLI